jgi:hypothetical protein
VRRIEDEPQQTAKLSDQPCVVKNGTVHDNHVVSRDDKSILPANPWAKNVPDGRVTDGAMLASRKSVHHI